MSGQHIGRWTVLNDCISTESGERKWYCRCDCGTERYVLERALKYGGSQSCGCVRLERVNETIAHDLTGKTFGNLTVVEKAAYQRKNGGIWWTCKCTCGKTYDVPGTLLVTGRRTHCPDKSHERNYVYADITGKKFERLTALYPTDSRDSKGSVVWHCRCDCGNEIDIPYNQLVYANIQSCGCKKKEHDSKLPGFLIHIDGTSLDMIKSKKIPSDNTTGCRGVYRIRGKYVAKIVFQKKAYYLGTYDTIEPAIEVRKKAEKILYEQTVLFYQKWKNAAERDPEWAVDHPMKVFVEKDTQNELTVTYFPDVDGMLQNAH